MSATVARAAIATSMMTTTMATATAATVVMSATVARATVTAATASTAKKTGRCVATEHGEANNREENRNTKHYKSVHSEILQ